METLDRTRTNEAPADQWQAERVNSALADLAAMPWDCASIAHQWCERWFQDWAQICLCPAFPPHPCEGRHQLDVPDPIEAAGEKDLFA